MLAHIKSTNLRIPAVGEDNPVAEADSLAVVEDNRAEDILGLHNIADSYLQENKMVEKESKTLNEIRFETKQKPRNNALDWINERNSTNMSKIKFRYANSGHIQ